MAKDNSYFREDYFIKIINLLKYFFSFVSKIVKEETRNFFIGLVFCAFSICKFNYSNVNFLWTDVRDLPRSPSSPFLYVCYITEPLKKMTHKTSSLRLSPSNTTLYNISPILFLLSLLVKEYYLSCECLFNVSFPPSSFVLVLISYHPSQPTQPNQKEENLLYVLFIYKGTYKDTHLFICQ